MNTSLFQRKSLIFFISVFLFLGVFVSMAFATINNLILTDPLGGEEWRGTQNITWTHTDNGSSGPISILLSSDGGANYNTLVTGVDVTLDTYFWDTSGTTDGSTYKIKINDLSSGIAYESDTNFIVDNTDPITGYAIAPLTPNGENGWYVGTAPVVTLTPTDNLAGIYKTYYRFDGGPYTEYSAPFSAPEGEHTLEYYSEDNAVDSTGIRNVEVTHSQVIKTDVTIPTGAMTYSKNPVKLGDVLTITADFSEPLQDSPVVNLAISGANTSGPGAMTKVTTTQYTYVYTVGAGDGTATVALSIGKDVAGNSITASPTTGGTFIVDNIAPTLSEVTPVPTPTNDNTPNYTFSSNEVGTITYTGSCSSLETLAVNGNNTITFSSLGDGSYSGCSMKVTDDAGNESLLTASLFLIDTLAPAVDAGTDKESNLMVPVQNAQVTDPDSGIASYQWTKINGSGTITFGTPTAEDTSITASVEDSYLIRLTVIDNAGNSAFDDMTYVYDVTAPLLTEVSIVTSPTNNTTPSWKLGVDHVSSVLPGGAIAYTGACGVGNPTTATAGSNVITFSPLLDAIYSDCSVMVTDAAGNQSLPLALTTFEIDTIVANVSSIVTTDEDEDGRVDTATIVFTDEMKDSTFAPADFTIGGVLATSFSTGSTPDDATVILSHAGVAGTEAKTVAYNAGTVTDLAGNVRGSFSSGSTDEAKPVLLSARTTSVTEIEATFSEDLDGTTVNGTGNEFTVSGYAVSAASETAPGVITLTVATMPTDATPIVTYTANSLLNDKAIVPNTAVTPTSVTAVDEVAPTLSSVTISSDNDGDILDPEWAKVGDTATLTFTSSEAIATPTVTIDGMSATVSGGPTAWSAAYTFVGGESDGTVPFSITFADLAAPTPNVGITVTATGDGSTVFFDEVVPSVNAGTDKEVNAVVAQEAAVSDPTPASDIATYLWTNQTPGVGTITFGSATAEDTTISADTDGTYTIRLTVTDNAGNSQFDEMIFIWDTTNPEPLTSSPSDGLTGVAITAGTAMVTYDEPIVLLDNSRVLIVRDSDGASFKGAVAVSGLSQTVLNVDYTGLAFGTKYRINVKPNALEDVAGNNLATNFISYFTTEIDTIPPVVNSFSASSMTTTGATLNVTTDESATCSYATTDSAYSSMTAFDGPNTGTSHTAVLTGLSPATGHDYFVRCADTTAETNTMTTSAHVSFTTLTPDTTGPVISNIQTGSITQTGVTITWTTDEDATDRVEYGLTSSYGSMSGVDTIADNTSHSVSLTGLTAGTVYHFRVLSSDAIPNAETSVDGTFRTSEPDPDTVAPPVPSIITGAASVNSDSYQISGNAGADTPTPTVRTISLYNGATLVGTAVVPIGQTGWSVSVTLTQDTANSFNAVSADAFGNVSDASSPVVITEDATVGADTTPPADPTFTTVDTTIDADTYELTGFASDDGGVRTITIKNSDGVVVGTAILPEGDEDWAIEVVLEQDASNTFFVTSMDASGNLSNSDDVTITEESTPDITPPVITLLGVNPQTLTVGDSYVELGATASDDMDGDISADLDIDSTAVNMAEVGTYTVTYNVSDASSNGATEETRTVIVEAAFDDTALLVVTGIDAVKTYATADDSYANGWSWVYHITVPTNETSFKMKFSDFISGLNSILAANNIRFYSSQSSAHADQGHAIDITASNSYSAVAILDTDLDSATAGRQIEVTVEMKVPLSSAGGSYSGSYGIFSEI